MCWAIKTTLSPQKDSYAVQIASWYWNWPHDISLSTTNPCFSLCQWLFQSGITQHKKPRSSLQMSHTVNLPISQVTFIQLKLGSYWFKKSRRRGKKILWPSHLLSGISYVSSMASLYWSRPRIRSAGLFYTKKWNLVNNKTISSIYLENKAYRSAYEFTKGTPYLPLACKQWSFFCECFEDKRSCFSEVQLHPLYCTPLYEKWTVSNIC